MGGGGTRCGGRLGALAAPDEVGGVLEFVSLRFGGMVAMLQRGEGGTALASVVRGGGTQQSTRDGRGKEGGENRVVGGGLIEN